MLGALILLLVTVALSGVMLLVLWSLSGAGIKGVKEWMAANVLAIVALLLFAGRPVLPGLLSVEAANTLFMVAIAAMLAGFRRHLSLPVPAGALGRSIAIVLAFVAFFHYWSDSSALRSVAVSAFHGGVCLGIAASVRSAEGWRTRYPYRFTAAAAFVLALAHGFRGLVYSTHAGAIASPLDGSTLNLLFTVAATIAIPALTLGAVMMAKGAISPLARS